MIYLTFFCYHSTSLLYCYKYQLCILDVRLSIQETALNPHAIACLGQDWKRRVFGHVTPKNIDDQPHDS